MAYDFRFMTNVHFNFQPCVCFNDRTVSLPHYLSITFYGIPLNKRVKGVFIEASKHIIIMSG